MPNLFNEIAQILSNVSNIPQDRIAPQSHLVNDLQIDSLGILDATFDIEKKYEIKIPIETWITEMSAQGITPTAFTMEFLVSKIQNIIDQK